MSIKVFKDPPEVADDMRQLVVTHFKDWVKKARNWMVLMMLLVKNIKVRCEWLSRIIQTVVWRTGIKKFSANTQYLVSQKIAWETGLTEIFKLKENQCCVIQTFFLHIFLFLCQISMEGGECRSWGMWFGGIWDLSGFSNIKYNILKKIALLYDKDHISSHSFFFLPWNKAFNFTHPPSTTPTHPQFSKRSTFTTLETLITSLVIIFMEIGAMNLASVSYAREKCGREISSFSRILEI